MAVSVLTPVGVPVAGTTAITPALPVVTFQDGDLIVGFGETAAQAFPSIATNGFAHVDLSPVSQDTNTRLHVVWRRWTAGLTAHNWGDSGDHNIGAYVAYRGVKLTGNPWNAVISDFDAILDNSAQWPTLTTTVDDCRVLFIGGWSINANCGALSGGTGLGPFTEWVDFASLAGNDGAVFVSNAVKATAGATGTPTATLTLNAFKAMMTLALEPEPAAGLPPQARQYSTATAHRPSAVFV
jgi:hypothetical protein